MKCFYEVDMIREGLCNNEETCYNLWMKKSNKYEKNVQEYPLLFTGNIIHIFFILHDFYKTRFLPVQIPRINQEVYKFMRLRTQEKCCT